MPSARSQSTAVFHMGGVHETSLRPIRPSIIQKTIIAQTLGLISDTCPHESSISVVPEKVID